MIIDPFALLIFILVTIFFALLFWIPNRVTELLVAGEDERVPQSLKWLVKEEYIAAVHEGKKKHNIRKWRWIILILGSLYPLLFLCVIPAENLMTGLMIVTASAAVFLICVALLERLVWPSGK